MTGWGDDPWDSPDRRARLEREAAIEREGRELLVCPVCGETGPDLGRDPPVCRRCKRRLDLGTLADIAVSWVVDRLFGGG